MNGKKIRDLLRRTIHLLLLIVAAAFVITGFGITEFRVVESVTFGLLHKSLAFKIHNNLWIPFLTLLILHICFSYIFKFFKWKK